MRRFVFFIVFLTGLSGPAFAQARFPFTAEIVSDRVNIRAGQNNNFESVAMLSKGDQIGVLSKNFKWYKVALPDGAKAFVKSEYVKLLDPGLGEVLADHLNVRSLPNATATSIGQLSKGQKVIVQQDQDGWLAIQPANGLYGWVYESLIVFKKNGLPTSKGADPEALAAAKALEASKLQARKAFKAALLKKSADGTVECTGLLEKVYGGLESYQVTIQEVPACFVDGPRNVLDSFVGSNVSIKGRLKSMAKDMDVGVVVLLKISLAL